MTRAVEPKFARITVFAPRIPHGVRTVTGTHDPRAGRLVIHSWFVQPRLFVQGPLATRALSARIAELGGQLGDWLDGLAIAGLVSVAFGVDRRGMVRAPSVLPDTTRMP